MSFPKQLLSRVKTGDFVHGEVSLLFSFSHQVFTVFQAYRQWVFYVLLPVYVRHSDHFPCMNSSSQLASMGFSSPKCLSLKFRILLARNNWIFTTREDRIWAPRKTELSDIWIWTNNVLRSKQARQLQREGAQPGRESWGGWGALCALRNPSQAHATCQQLCPVPGHTNTERSANGAGETVWWWIRHSEGQMEAKSYGDIEAQVSGVTLVSGLLGRALMMSRRTDE